MEIRLESLPIYICAHLLVTASRRATCNTTFPTRMFLKTEIASECDMPWSAKPLTAKTSSPENDGIFVTICHGVERAKIKQKLAFFECALVDCLPHLKDGLDKYSH